MARLTQTEVNHYFKQITLEQIAKEYEQDGVPDKPARREAYNNLLDNLHKHGRISDEDVNEWCIPDELETTKYWL